MRTKSHGLVPLSLSAGLLVAACAAAHPPTPSPPAGTAAAPAETPLVLGSGQPAPVPGLVSEARPGMGTILQLQARAVGRGRVRAAFDAAFAELERVEAMMSEWRPDSAVTALNRGAGGPPTAVPAELLALLQQAEEVSRLTGGAFDVTWAGLRGLWRFDDGATPPTEQQIAARLPLVDHHQLTLDPKAGTAQLAREGMAVGLGGIAKGYGVDRAAQVLREAGLTDFIVFAGGDLYLSGERSPGVPWRVGLQHPRRPGALIATIDAPPGAVVTSGDYEHSFEHEGVRYHHILSPETGRPARGCISLTVLSQDATLADALATGMFVMGAERALELAESLPGVEAVVVSAGDPLSVRSTSGLQGKLRVHAR